METVGLRVRTGRDVVLSRGSSIDGRPPSFVLVFLGSSEVVVPDGVGNGHEGSRLSTDFMCKDTGCWSFTTVTRGRSGLGT